MLPIITSNIKITSDFQIQNTNNETLKILLAMHILPQNMLKTLERT